jgi:hypothetical protein
MSAEILTLAPRAQARKEVGEDRYRPDTGGRVLQIFLNADLRNGHEGLAELAKERGIDVTKLLPGQYVVFVNAGKDKLKLYAAANVLAYLKLTGGQKFDLRVIAFIPKAFNGSGKLDYDKALKDAVEEALRKRMTGKLSGSA